MRKIPWLVPLVFLYIYLGIYVLKYRHIFSYIYMCMDTTTFWDYLTYVVNYCTLTFQTKLELDWLQDVFTLVLHGLRVSHFIHNFAQFLISNQDAIVSSNWQIFCCNDIKRILRQYHAYWSARGLPITSFKLRTQFLSCILFTFLRFV